MSNKEMKVFLGIISLVLSLTYSVFVNQYSINDFILPFFGVDIVLGYWQTILFTGVWGFLIANVNTALSLKKEDQTITIFLWCLFVPTLQWIFTSLAIHYIL